MRTKKAAGNSCLGKKLVKSRCDNNILFNPAYIGMYRTHILRNIVLLIWVLSSPDEGKEFLPRFRILSEDTQHGTCNSFTVDLLNPSHHHTHVPEISQ